MLEKSDNYLFKSFNINNFYVRKINLFQYIKMFVIGNNKISTCIESAIYEFVIIEVGKNQQPFIINCYRFCIRCVENGFNYQFCKCGGIVTRQYFLILIQYFVGIKQGKFFYRRKPATTKNNRNIPAQKQVNNLYLKLFSFVRSS